MLKVALIPHPDDFENREKLLCDKINEIISNKSNILFMTSDSEGYTVVYKENKTLND